MIATEAVEAIEAIVEKNNGEFVPLVASACTPLCVSLMSAPDKFVGTQVSLEIFFLGIFGVAWSDHGGERERKRKEGREE